MPDVLFQVVHCYIFDALQRVQTAQQGPNSSYFSCYLSLLHLDSLIPYSSIRTFVILFIIKMFYIIFMLIKSVLLDVSVSYGLFSYFSDNESLYCGHTLLSVRLWGFHHRWLSAPRLFNIMCAPYFHTDGRFSAEMCLLFGHKETQVCSPRAPEWVLFTVWSCSLAPEGPDTPNQHQNN